MNKTIFMSLMALVVSVAFVSAGMAQQKPAPAKVATAPAAPARQSWEKTTGLIEKVDPANKEVVVQTEKEKLTFSSGQNTHITEGTAKTPLSALKRGMSVTVEYQKEGNKLLAEWIDVNMAKAEVKAAPQVQSKETKEVKKESKEMKKENPSEKTMEKK